MYLDKVLTSTIDLVPFFVLTFSTQLELSPWCCLVSTAQGLEALSDRPVV